MCDVALDPYTSHGHDGMLNKNYVMNDETVEHVDKSIFVTSSNGL